MRASRGAYLPWGLAEEAASAVGWLEKRSLAVVTAFTGLLTANDGVVPESLGPDHIHLQTLGKTTGALCPILTGAYLRDSAKTVDLEQGITLGPTMYPVFLLPFLAGFCGARDCSVSVSWPSVQVHVHCNGATVLAKTCDLNCPTAESLSIIAQTATDQVAPDLLGRCEVTDVELADLNAMAVRTFLPESELSRVSGAGGFRVDDD